uniref:DUF569 domain-containing protein n=1 Tax=Hordeum vulgare subsp. vulgare TaxID=112509 RepID=A0A8I6YNC2_HORVV
MMKPFTYFKMRFLKSIFRISEIIMMKPFTYFNVAWAVHVYHAENGDGPYLLLHSAAYGRYLAATDTPLPRGPGHFRVEQRGHDQPGAGSAMWKVIAGGGVLPNDVRLRNVGGHYLRVHGSFPAAFYWSVEPIPARDGAPRLPPPFPEVPPAWRLIRFRLETDDGWSQFEFRGSCVYNLRKDLAMLLNLPLQRRYAFVMFVRAGRYGRLTPLVVDLPWGGSGETLELVVMLSGTPAYDALRHPDVDAE